MNKNETKVVDRLETMWRLGGYEQNVAQALSALIRAARTDKSRCSLLAIAEAWQIKNNPDFIV